jgi:hypothetical protein
MQFFAPLICEDGEHISLGRVLLLVVFGYLTHFWFWSEYEVPTSLLTLTEALIIYNFGKKLIGPIADAITAKAK